MAVENINSITPLSQISGVAGKPRVAADGFGSMINDAVESIDSSQKNADSEISKAVTGESPDLHKTIIALQTADLKFQLGLQVRNKLLGAYDEIMRMPV